MARFSFDLPKLVTAAVTCRLGTTFGKAAAAADVDRGTKFTRKNDILLADIRVGNGDCRKQRFGIWVLGIFKQSFGGPPFNKLAKVHNDDVV